MKFILDKLVLCDHGRSSPVDFRVHVRKVVQTDEGVRAESVRNRDRRNVRTDVTLTARREHGSFAECDAFIADHTLEAMDRSGVLEMEQIKNNGGTQSTFLANAIIADVVMWRIGVASYATYQIVGGRLSKKRS